MVTPLQFSPGGPVMAVFLLIFVVLFFAGIMYVGYSHLQPTSGNNDGTNGQNKELETEYNENR